MTNAFSRDYSPAIKPEDIKSTSKLVKKVEPHVNSHIYLGKKETSQERADGTRWNEAPKPGYNPLGKARDAD